MIGFLSHGNVKVMEIGEGKAQHYNKQMDMGRILLKGEPGISSPGWQQDTTSVKDNRILCSIRCRKFSVIRGQCASCRAVWDTGDSTFLKHSCLCPGLRPCLFCSSCCHGCCTVSINFWHYLEKLIFLFFKVKLEYFFPLSQTKIVVYCYL